MTLVRQSESKILEIGEEKLVYKRTTAGPHFGRYFNLKDGFQHYPDQKCPSLVMYGRGHSVLALLAR